MDLNKVGNFIKELREAKGWSQKELAKIVVVHRTTVTKWENGSSLPNNDSILLLSKIFDVSIDEILNGHMDAAKEETTKNVVLPLLDSRRKYIKKFKIILFTLIIIVITFLSYYFFMTYNSISVYTTHLINERYLSTNGLIVVSNEKTYLKLSNFYNDKYELVKTDKVDIYYLDENNEKVSIFVGDPATLIWDYSKSKQFYFDIFKNKKLYLETTLNGKKEIFDFTVSKDFQNNGLLFEDSMSIKSMSTTHLRLDKNILLNHGFKYDQRSDSLVFSNDKSKINCLEDANYCVIMDMKNNKRYFLNFLNQTVEMTISNGNNIIYNLNDDNEEVKYLKENYLDKYFHD